jgi:4,5-DOPA dioxygenase extradiol
MNRSNFLKVVLGAGGVASLDGDNEFSRRWQAEGRSLPTPQAILVVSAHWLTSGTHITAMEHPETIHDFGGFPKELQETQYPAPGSPKLAMEASRIIQKTKVILSHDWGLDHGAWTIVRQMFPTATIPVLQLSIDYRQPARYHYELARELAVLRTKGVLIIGSGNMVHNLRMLYIPGNNPDNFNQEFGFDWALEMNEIFKKHILSGNHTALIEYEKLSKSVKLAVPTPDHYYPLLYALALQQKDEQPEIFNDKAIAGAFTMTSVKTA